MGVYLVPQEAHIFPHLGVLDNICIGLPGRPSDYRDPVAGLVAGLGVTLDLTTQGATLEIADRQIVEVLRGLICEARVLILDEPTSALTPYEVSALFQTLRQLRAAGVGMVFISHKLPELRAISDRITVLRDGVVVHSDVMAASSDQQILTAMSPALRVHEANARERSSAGEALRIEGLTGEGFANVSLALGVGEIVGLAGVVGAGRTQLAETLVGLRPVRSGRVSIGGRPGAIDPRARRRRRAWSCSLRTGSCTDSSSRRRCSGTFPPSSAIACRRSCVRTSSGRASRRTGRRWGSSARDRTRSPARCRVATSRRCCSPAVSPPSRRSCSSTSRPVASTLARETTSTG